MVDQINTHEVSDTEASAVREHNDEMLAKAENLNQEPDASRPEWLPEKFQNAEDMAQAYRELEKKLGTEPDDEDNLFEDFDPNETTADDAYEFLDEAGYDYEAFAQEYAENGELSQAAYEALAEAGIPHQIVDAYIQGQEAVAADMQQQAMDLVGGQQEYAAMTQWAANNLSAGEVAAFNSYVNSGDMNQVALAIDGLNARYRNDVGSQPNLIQGQAQGTSAGLYNSVAEVTRDMQDPRYSSDPAFRQMVALKLQNSDVL
jgi:hypothetical protein